MVQEENVQMMMSQFQAYSSTMYTTVIPRTSENFKMSQNIFILGNVMIWVFLSVGILGLLNNAFVIFIIAKSPQLRQQPRNWFIFHQSIADFLSAITITTSLTKSANMKLNDVSIKSRKLI